MHCTERIAEVKTTMGLCMAYIKSTYVSSGVLNYFEDARGGRGGGCGSKRSAAHCKPCRRIHVCLWNMPAGHALSLLAHGTVSKWIRR